MNVADYLNEVRANWASGQATEHSYGPLLEGLFRSVDPSLGVINEPRKSEAGMPDFLFQRGDVPIGWRRRIHWSGLGRPPHDYETHT